MPLRNTVLFPQQVIPIYIGREKSLKLIEDLGPGDKHIVVVAQEDGSIEDPKPEDLYAYGTLGVVLKVFDMPDNSKSAIVQGVERVKLLSFGEAEPYYTAGVERMKDNPVSDDLELDALAKNLRDTFTELIQVAPNLTEEHSGMLSNIPEALPFSGSCCFSAYCAKPGKTRGPGRARSKNAGGKKTITLLTREIQRIKLGEEIQTEVHDEISKTQREYYLREQMKAIKRELGEDEETVEIKELEDRIKAAGLPEEAQKVAMKELDRLTRVPHNPPQNSVSRTYIEWLADLPWSKSSDDQINVKKAEKIWMRITMDWKRSKNVSWNIWLSGIKQKRNPDGVVRGPILCFSGPPGVGKTSLGKSIARAIGREFVRMSLGGVRDEAEIRGHRRTYIGPCPAGSFNP
ncbi:MAG: hypothetical protein CM1200mP10_18700 [Candidatus Neomarinimicrobiota bacterium]|nr:MAG: hypothetical protein CM1200mP10_18700 [Candidatus Neomarinimicrobiota bacterium]